MTFIFVCIIIALIGLVCLEFHYDTVGVFCAFFGILGTIIACVMHSASLDPERDKNMLILQTPTFLDFSTKGTLSDVVKRFGNPMKIEEKESKVSFTFQRSEYIFSVQVDEKSSITEMTATGFNKFVSYRKVHLSDDFSSIIKNCGNPSSFDIQDDEIHLNFEDCVYQLNKLRGMWTVTSIKVWGNIKK